MLNAEFLVAELSRTLTTELLNSTLMWNPRCSKLRSPQPTRDQTCIKFKARPFQRQVVHSLRFLKKPIFMDTAVPQAEETVSETRPRQPESERQTVLDPEGHRMDDVKGRQPPRSPQEGSCMQASDRSHRAF